MRGSRKRDRGGVKQLTDSLIREIHALNAEAKSCRDAYVREQIYLSKTQLQSHLLREWGEHFDVFGDPEFPGTVTLSRRLDGRDACHARVADLDPDVRAEFRL